MLQGNRIIEFLEKEKSEGIRNVNTSVYILQPDVLNLVDAGRPAQFETDVIPRLAAIDELSAFLFQGIWFDIRDADSYVGAKRRWMYS